MNIAGMRSVKKQRLDAIVDDNAHRSVTKNE